MEQTVRQKRLSTIKDYSIFAVINNCTALGLKDLDDKDKLKFIDTAIDSAAQDYLARNFDALGFNDLKSKDKLALIKKLFSYNVDMGSMIGIMKSLKEDEKKEIIEFILKDKSQYIWLFSVFMADMEEEYKMSVFTRLINKGNASFVADHFNDLGANSIDERKKSVLIKMLVESGDRYAISFVMENFVDFLNQLAVEEKLRLIKLAACSDAGLKMLDNLFELGVDKFNIKDRISIFESIISREGFRAGKIILENSEKFGLTIEEIKNILIDSLKAGDINSAHYLLDKFGSFITDEFSPDEKRKVIALFADKGIAKRIIDDFLWFKVSLNEEDRFALAVSVIEKGGGGYSLAQNFAKLGLSALEKEKRVRLMKMILQGRNKAAKKSLILHLNKLGFKDITEPAKLIIDTDEEAILEDLYGKRKELGLPAQMAREIRKRIPPFI